MILLMLGMGYKLKAYGLVHSRSYYNWKGISVNVGVENVFDKLYSNPLGGVYFGHGKIMSGTGVDWGFQFQVCGLYIR